MLLLGPPESMDVPKNKVCVADIASEILKGLKWNSYIFRTPVRVIVGISSYQDANDMRYVIC